METRGFFLDHQALYTFKKKRKALCEKIPAQCFNQRVIVMKTEAVSISFLAIKYLRFIHLKQMLHNLTLAT